MACIFPSLTLFTASIHQDRSADCRRTSVASSYVSSLLPLLEPLSNVAELSTPTSRVASDP
jgi:hypothetical protein